VTDDVIARAKRERERYITSGWMETIRPFNEVIALAESQAAQLSAIRERIKPWALCNSPNQTGYQAALEAILAAIFGILDGTTDD